MSASKAINTNMRKLEDRFGVGSNSEVSSLGLNGENVHPYMALYLPVLLPGASFDEAEELSKSSLEQSGEHYLPEPIQSSTLRNKRLVKYSPPVCGVGGPLKKRKLAGPLKKRRFHRLPLKTSRNV